MKDTDKHLCIEVGSRNRPFIQELRKDLYPKNSLTVLVDKRYGGLHSFSPKLYSPEMKRIQAWGQELPIKSNSAVLVFAKDLFGADGYYAFDPNYTFERERVGKGLQKEWKRVLKHGGKVVVLELATPVEKQYLIESFIDAGFKKNEVYTSDDHMAIFEGFANSKNDKKKRTHLINKEQYSLVFEKK